MHDINLPQELLAVIGNERIEFATHAKRYQSKTASIVLFAFATFWCGFVGIFVVAFFGPLFIGEEVHFSSNGEPVVASIDNLKPMILPGLIIGFFALVGIGLMILAIRNAFKDGGYFAGTTTRFISYRQGKLNSYDWEQFNGSIEANFSKGDITFELRTGNMVSRKNGPDRYVPNSIHLSGVTNIEEIERISRKRIKENDPTPINEKADPSI